MPSPFAAALLASFTTAVVIAQEPAPTAPDAKPARRPNIVLILSDDMGWSDLGCYGGEIATPNLDALAASGVRMTDFYNCGRCCPTRASLMSGLHPHQAGIGWMTEVPAEEDPAPDHGDFGTDAYRGRLRLTAPTIADTLRHAGYRTLMCGKWHLGLRDKAYWPTQRGFEHFFGIQAGAARYFDPAPPRGLWLDDEPVAATPTRDDEPFYLTDAITDHAITFLEQAETADDEQPFFLYLAYTAPHWPLHARAEDVARYRQRYTEGWDVLRERRHARQIELGLVDPSWQLPPRDGPAWDSLPAKRRDEMAHKMAIYAAMVDRMDQDIGRLLGALDRLDERDDTLIVFLNDNGGCAEGGTWGWGSDKDLDTWREFGTSYGRMWAQAGNTPFREYKHFVHEGGIATPMIVAWPAAIDGRHHGALRHQPGYLPDLLPTFAAAAGAELLGPSEGVDLLPQLVDDAAAQTRQLFWEHEGNAAVRDGDWKLVRRHSQGEAFQLYHLPDDRSEQHDLAAAQPERTAAMTAAWRSWADRVGVLPWRGPEAMRGQRPAEQKAEHDRDR